VTAGAGVHTLCQDCSMYVLIRIAASAAALAVATVLLPGITLGPGSLAKKVLWWLSP
jgi:hypothetical protein